VRVLVPWVPNHVVTDWIAHSYFTDCLDNGIRIFGYRYTMLHAKTCTIDGQWSTVGTCNLDRLSLVGNYEINLAVYSTEFAQQMSALFTGDTAERFELTMEQWKSRPWYRSYTHLVIKAHQHGALKMSIRSHYDFWKDIRSSATVDSPNLCKNGGTPK
jgi:cardiolipin synthase